MLRYIGETNEHFVKNGVYEEVLLAKSHWANVLLGDIAKKLDTDIKEAHRARTIISDNGEHVLMTVEQALEKFIIVQKPTLKLKNRLRENLEKTGEIYREQRRILQDLLENHVAYTNLTFWYGYEDERDGGFDTKVVAIVEEDNESFRIEFYDRKANREKYWIYIEDFLDKFDFVPLKEGNGPLRDSLDYSLLQDYVEPEEDVE
ncbi:hypothetical protein NIGALANA_173 [Bacillus phage Nigalana]|uniref:hypothetical protein n=1 Tax=Bacillus phage Nigalana TaxID=1805951 RepID=UPI0007A76FCA|nr:hypothetical protein BI005_gp173 [Bacillus phage Nigalana]AMW61323.1 hypothetical protein NIGALANA_173 [Bacillus phage Nigalana]